MSDFDARLCSCHTTGSFGCPVHEPAPPPAEPPPKRRVSEHVIRTKRLTPAEASAARALGYDVELCSKHGGWVDNEMGCPGCVYEACGLPWPVDDETSGTPGEERQ